MIATMKRREFITLLGGAAAAWPLAARAQQVERMRRVGVLGSLAEQDAESVARSAVFEQTLQGFGWSVGRNLVIDYRYSAGDPVASRKLAAELAALKPNVILVSGNVVIAPMMQAAPTIPIVFVQIIDPVGSGLVESMRRPGGHVTGFTQFEYSLAGKWLELLREVAPRVTRVAVVRDPTRGPGIGQFAVVQAMASPHALELTPINAADTFEAQAERLAAFASSPNGGVIVTPGGTAIQRDVLITAVAKNHLPAIYPYRYFAADGGLISYGPDTIAQYSRAAGYIDRILKGEKPADLPVQAPTKYELVINLKTARALGLEMPPALLARADEVIE